MSKDTKMQILVSNDDGVHAEGIRVLANALKDLAMVKVVAPDRNRSGASNSLTLDRPIRVKTLENGAISVEGTPTDCVHLAITGLLEQPPSMVVSGINEGGNLGDDVLYSGTVAAAIEGRFLVCQPLRCLWLFKAAAVRLPIIIIRRVSSQNDWCSV